MTIADGKSTKNRTFLRKSDILKNFFALKYANLSFFLSLSTRVWASSRRWLAGPWWDLGLTSRGPEVKKCQKIKNLKFL